jgi:hypothetical protein
MAHEGPGCELCRLAPSKYFGTWSRAWKRCSTPTLLATGPADLRSMPYAKPVGAAGATTGCSNRRQRLLRQYRLGAVAAAPTRAVTNSLENRAYRFAFYRGRRKG